jgi:hypothetical protein
MSLYDYTRARARSLSLSLSLSLSRSLSIFEQRAASGHKVGRGTKAFDHQKLAGRRAPNTSA